MTEYLESFLQQKRHFRDFPSHVHIETTGRCNGRCTFCPHGSMDRRDVFMSDALFEKIVDDLAEIPGDRRFAVSPLKVNEPLMDPKIFDRMARLTDRLPNAILWLTTNLNTLTPEMLDRLAEIPRIGHIWISLNSMDPQQYRSIMGLDPERTVRNIHLLLDRHKESPLADKIILGRVASETPSDREFVDAVHRQFGDGPYGVGSLALGNWCGAVPSRIEVPSLPCARWFELSICCTGRVALCCMDGLCEHAIGDVNTESVLNVYNAPGYRKLRERCHSRREVEPCDRCAFL